MEVKFPDSGLRMNPVSLGSPNLAHVILHDHVQCNLARERSSMRGESQQTRSTGTSHISLFGDRESGFQNHNTENQDTERDTADH